MSTALIKNLGDLHSIITGLGDDEISFPLDVLSGSSIGAHVRHVLEFYQTILVGDTCNIICYDERRRDVRIETDRTFAAGMIRDIQTALAEIKEDKRLLVKCNFKIDKESSVLLDSSLFRELAYAFEHSVHHQALIKIGVRALGRGEILPHNFGIAPSTARFKSQVPSALPN